ncbi:MAG: YitT family protein [Saprospiraceae bacterium]|nr:YitT family protein [Saprospiraceae bacterium]
MKKFIKKLVFKFILQKKKTSVQALESYSDYRFAKGFRELKIVVTQSVKDAFLILLGIASAAFGLESFLLPNNFIDGGATGISLLIAELTGIPLYFLLIGINLPFIFIGYHVIGKEFAIKTAIAISLLALCVANVHFPEITHDKFLVALFGGAFLGAGIGLSVRGGAVIDGTEVLAIFLSRKFGVSIGDIIIILNVIIFSFAAYVMSIDTALYAMITYLAASKTLDFVIDGIEEYTAVTIISCHSKEIKDMIINELGHGVTIYKGKGGFGNQGEKNSFDILYTVVTRLELNRLNTEILKIDTNAFVVMSTVKDTKGGMIKKRPMAH